LLAENSPTPSVGGSHGTVVVPALTREQAVSLAERYVAAYNNRDLDAMLDVHPSIVSYPSRLAGAQRHEGHAGVRAWWQTMLASGQWYEVVIRDIQQPSADRVAIIGEIRDQGERISPWCVIVQVREGLISESRSYLTETDLLDQLGLLKDTG
jgi:SnoaL-like domain